MTLGERIKELREHRGYSQAELGRRVGMTQVAISKVEQGLTRDPKKIDLFAKALSTSIEWLRDGRGVKHADAAFGRGGTKTAGGFGDTGYHGKRRKVMEMLDAWETLSPLEQDEFLAVAMIHKKDPDGKKAKK